MFKLATLASALATFSSVMAVPVEDARPVHSGEATYFYQNGNAGSCGQYHSDSDYIVAISPAGYTVSNHCGKQVTITNTETGITATATVADSCYGNNGPCPAQNLDLSVGLWQHLHGSNNLDEGEFHVNWHFD